MNSDSAVSYGQSYGVFYGGGCPPYKGWGATSVSPGAGRPHKMFYLLCLFVCLFVWLNKIRTVICLFVFVKFFQMENGCLDACILGCLQFIYTLEIFAQMLGCLDAASSSTLGRTSPSLAKG